uniref:16S rRNA (guanine(527)-N(7))-methyltransferase RsmG n=1 Tax=Yoonia sp. TaxID=2212373 RepID=UPI0040479CE6|tara:strand:+ start:120384 stop:121004 length:621 start_codon:yes stop_codon:yes gene_type:complete
MDSMVDLAGTNVSRETITRLTAFAALTTKWTPHINLVARSTLDDLWTRHIVDSAQIFQYAPAGAARWVDVGSGGGFPGIVVAAIAADLRPEMQFTLIESDQRKATFLRTAARELQLDIEVIADRVELVAPQNADIISARALSSLHDLFPLILRHLSPDAISILPKGKSYAEEISLARQNWRFELDAHPSMTEPDARILVVKDIARD